MGAQTGCSAAQWPSTWRDQLSIHAINPEFSGELADAAEPNRSFVGSLTEFFDICGVPQEGRPSQHTAAISGRSVRAGTHLVHEGGPVETLYLVRSGTFKTYRVAEDGYEQVLTFSIRGELLTYDAMSLDQHPAGVVALEDSTALMIPHRQVKAWMETVPGFASAICRAGGVTLMRSRELVDVLAAVSSEVRLARFLLLYGRRMKASGQSPRQFHLRMDRRELGSLLGVAHETVSRGFGTLAAMGFLHVTDRYIDIVDMAGLHTFARHTRRTVEHAEWVRQRSVGACQTPNQVVAWAA